MHNPTLHQGPLGKDFAMNRTRPSTHILTSGFSIGFFLLLCTQSGLAAEAVGGPTRIHVDPGRVVAHGVDRKLGIGLNFTIDRNDRTLRNALQKLGVSAIRFQEGELGDNWHFDAADPASPILGVADPKIWYHRSKTDGKRWLSTLTPADFLDLAATQQLDAYSIVGIDTLVYDGSAPHLSRTEVIASAEAFVRFAGETADRLQRPEPIIKYWEIGNENDLQGMLGQFKLGHTWKAAEYAQLAAELATRMKRADARILIGVNGMTPKSDWWRDVLTSEVTVAGQSRRLVELIDFLVTHQYSWVANYKQWRDAGGDWDYARNVATTVDMAGQFAPGKPIAVTEWSAYSPSRKGDKDHANNAWHAIHNLQMLGEILKHESVTHACFWDTRWSLDASKLHNALTPDGELTPVGESLRFWSEFVKPDLVEAGSRRQYLRVRDERSRDRSVGGLPAQSQRPPPVDAIGRRGRWGTGCNTDRSTLCGRRRPAGVQRRASWRQ